MAIPKTDSDTDAWRFYEFFYGENLNDKSCQKRLLNCNSTSIEANGDVCFNVKLMLPCIVHKKPSYRYSLLGSIIKDSIPNTDVLYSLLDCFLHSPMNISLLPKTGGLNIIKQNYADDRFDSFIYLLSQYYEGITAPILNRGTQNSYFSAQKDLGDFLDAIQNIENFVSYFYGISDKKFTKSLITSGSKAICNSEDVFDYLKKAALFWRLRLNYLEERDYFSGQSELYDTYNKALNDLASRLNRGIS